MTQPTLSKRFMASAKRTWRPAALVVIGFVLYVVAALLPKGREEDMLSVFYFALGLPIPGFPEWDAGLAGGAYAITAFAFLFWSIGRFVRSDRALGALGWVSSIGCFVVFMLVDVRLWTEHASQAAAQFRPDGPALPVLLFAVISGAATLAMLSLFAAPARIRLGACMGLAGAWSLLLFAAAPVMFEQRHSDDGFTLFVLAATLVAGALITFGSGIETLRLWRHPESEKETP